MTPNSWRCIIIVTIITFTSVICDHCTWYNNIPTEAIYHCLEQNATNEYESKPRNQIIYEPNEDGSINFEFDYKPNCNYKLELYIWNNINDDISCKKHTMLLNKAYLHSTYTYSGISELNNDVNLGFCTERGNITLKYVYTGCYYIIFVNGNSVEYLERNFFTMPNITKLYYRDSQSKSIKVDHRSLDSKTFVDIIHPFIKQKPNIQLVIKCIKNCTVPYDELYKGVPSLNKYNADGLVYEFCETNDISCTVTNYTMKCILDGLGSGFYEFEYSFHNLIRCPRNRNGIWKNCGVKTNSSITNELNINTESSTSTPAKDSLVFWILLGVVCIGGFVLIAVIVTCRNKYGAYDGTIPFEYPTIEAFKGQSKILLLYPKDEDIVMKTMESLRKALIAEGIQVYDVYDQDQQTLIDEIDSSKWIINKLSDKCMKTVIVQTYCGQILANSSHSAEKLYKNPTCYDNIFPYALSLIRQRVDPNSYTKLFIVNIGFDEMKFSQFIFCNPSTRYGLPHSFKELARDLHEKKDYTVDIENSNELKEFTCMYRKMKDFIKDPSYLSDILKVSISHFDNNIKIEEEFKKESYII